MNPAVSIIIPTYNRAEMVPDAVRSALGQSRTDCEVIVVDDGSTDGTGEALRPYLERIRYVRQENRGIAGARNRGIEEANGEFLAFLDSDDMWERGLVDAVLRTFDQHPHCGAVFSAEVEIDSAGRRGRIHTKNSPGLEFTPESMISSDTGVGCGRPGVVRRSRVDDLGGYDTAVRVAVDCEMWIRYSFHMPMVLQPEPLVLRRLHEGHISGNMRQDAEDWLYLLDKVAAGHPEFVRTHRKIFRRAVAKQRLRFGREVLVHESGDRVLLAKARKALVRASLAYPAFGRCHTYVLWAYLAPSQYRRWRRFEMAHKRRRQERRMRRGG